MNDLQPIINFSLMRTPVGLLTLRHEFAEDENGHPYLQAGQTVSLGDVKNVVDALHGEGADGKFIAPDVFYVSSTMIGWRVPGRIRTLKFNVRGITFNITAPMPSMVIIANENRFIVCAVDDGAITPDMPCYYAPLMNFYDDGTMCQGSVKKPDVSPLENQKVWEDMIFDSYFSHISHQSLISGKDVSNESYIALLKSLSNKKRFPKRSLKPMNMTIKEFVNRGF
jgi:PRTRC genetic system protein B